MLVVRRRDALPQRLGLALTDNGLVAVDAQARTSLPGVYAAGALGASRHASCSSAAATLMIDAWTGTRKPLSQNVRQ